VSLGATVGTEPASLRRLRAAEAEVVRWRDAVEGLIEVARSRSTLDRDLRRGWLEDATQHAARVSAALPADLLDPEDLAEIRGVLIEALRAVEEVDGRPPLDAVEGLLLRVEEVRHVLRDAVEADAGADARTAADLLALLDEWLPDVRHAEKARLLDVTTRTLARWRQSDTAPSRRLRLVVRLVGLLRRAWTPAGVVSWFSRPREELGGKAPLEVLDDPEREAALLGAVRRGRAQHAT
jgi:hypothetical protein